MKEKKEPDKVASVDFRHPANKQVPSSRQSPPSALAKQQSAKAQGRKKLKLAPRRRIRSVSMWFKHRVVASVRRAQTSPASTLLFRTNTSRTQRLREHFAEHPPSLDSFEVGPTLGTGTYGRVRMVTCTDPEVAATKCFALKALQKAAAQEAQQITHIKSEKEVLMAISHPFIVSLYAAWHDSRRVYMLMEFVSGGELFSQLQRCKRLGEKAARFYAAEITLALEHLHSLEIVYRDLKPENVLIDHRGHVKLADFGFAKLLPNNARTYTICGTPDYLAPELVMGTGHGLAVDWWALGILIYEMLAGYAPYQCRRAKFGAFHKILAGAVRYPLHFDPEAIILIQQLLQKDPARRIGCLKRGARDIKSKGWFKHVSWSKAVSGTLKPPFVPSKSSSKNNSNFDKYNEAEQEPRQLSEAEERAFEGF